jgi:hypothetical protein
MKSLYYTIFLTIKKSFITPSLIKSKLFCLSFLITQLFSAIILPSSLLDDLKKMFVEFSRTAFPYKHIFAGLTDPIYSDALLIK